MNDLLTIRNLFACAISVVGAYTLVWLPIWLRKIRKMEAWPETTGQIIESTAAGEWDNLNSSLTLIYKPKIAYRYVVNGQEYTGRTIGPTEINTTLRRHAEDKIKQYPIGRTVPVFYDPFRPNDAVLQKEADSLAVASFGLVGGVFLVAGVWLLTGVI